MRERLFKYTQIDALVVGEGENTMLELVRRIEGGGRLEGINGLLYQEGEHIPANPPREPIRDLDTIPFPARHLLPMHLYGEYAGTVFTSRGCPFHCIFCSKPVFGSRWRTHTRIMSWRS